MRFTSYATVPGNRISTSGIAFLCLLKECVLFTRSERGCLEVPAAAAPGPDGWARTAISVQRVCDFQSRTLGRNAVFWPLGPVPFAGPPVAVTCVPLVADVRVSAGDCTVAAYWTLTGAFTFRTDGVTYEVLARTPPYGTFCRAANAADGCWTATVEAACQGCAALSRNWCVRIR